MVLLLEAVSVDESIAEAVDVSIHTVLHSQFGDTRVSMRPRKPCEKTLVHAEGERIFGPNQRRQLLVIADQHEGPAKSITSHQFQGLDRKRRSRKEIEKRERDKRKKKHYRVKGREGKITRE